MAWPVSDTKSFLQNIQFVGQSAILWISGQKQVKVQLQEIKQKIKRGISIGQDVNCMSKLCPLHKMKKVVLCFLCM